MVSARQVGLNPQRSSFGAAGQGHDYTSVSAWNSATALDLVTLQQSERLDCHDDAVSFSDVVVFSGATTDTNYFRSVGPVANQEHDGTSNNGVFFDGTGSQDQWAISEDNFAVHDLIFRFNYTGSSVRYCVNPSSANNTCAIGCIAFDGVGASGTLRGFNVNAGSIVVDCLADNMDHDGFFVASSTQASSRLRNCVAVNNGNRGYNEGSGTDNVVINCLGSGNSSADFDSGWNGASGYNASADGTAPGSNSRPNQTFTFVNAAGKDFHLALTDAGARNFGLAQDSDSLFPFDDDIDREVFDTWDIGFDEPEPAGGGPVVDVSLSLAREHDATFIAELTTNVDVTFARSMNLLLDADTVQEGALILARSAALVSDAQTIHESVLLLNRVLGDVYVGQSGQVVEALLALGKLLDIDTETIATVESALILGKINDFQLDFTKDISVDLLLAREHDIFFSNMTGGLVDVSLTFDKGLRLRVRLPQEGGELVRDLLIANNIRSILK